MPDTPRFFTLEIKALQSTSLAALSSDLKGKPIPQGWQDPSGLWRLSADRTHSSCGSGARKSVADTNLNNQAANVYTLPSIAQNIQFLNAATRFPTKDMWIAGVENGYFSTWPGLTAATVHIHFPVKSIEIQKRTH
jgi:hypothetical protein